MRISASVLIGTGVGLIAGATVVGSKVSDIANKSSIPGVVRGGAAVGAGLLGAGLIISGFKTNWAPARGAILGFGAMAAATGAGLVYQMAKD